MVCTTFGTFLRFPLPTARGVEKTDREQSHPAERHKECKSKSARTPFYLRSEKFPVRRIHWRATYRRERMRGLGTVAGTAPLRLTATAQSGRSTRRCSRCGAPGHIQSG